MLTVTGFTKALTSALRHNIFHRNRYILRASSYEPGNRAGSVAGTNSVMCSYGKFQPGRLVLVVDAMTSEESCYENDDNGNSKVVKYAVKRLSWQSRKLRKMKKSWTKLTKRAKERILPRTEAEVNTDCQPPNEFPQWALKE